MFIETGPHEHAIQQTFFLYVHEPGGNRVELRNPTARLVFAPDGEPITWTEAERAKQGRPQVVDAIRDAITEGDFAPTSGRSIARAVLARPRGQNLRRQFRLAMHPGRPAASLPQHLEVIEAIRGADPEAAMRRHLRSVIGALPEVEKSRHGRIDTV